MANDWVFWKCDGCGVWLASPEEFEYVNVKWLRQGSDKSSATSARYHWDDDYAALCKFCFEFKSPK